MVNNKLDLTGQRFGRLTAIKRVDNIGRRTAWECECDCGRKRIVTTVNLRLGRTTTCGHHSSALNLTGQKFGHLTAISRAKDIVNGKGKRKTAWLCECLCGNKKIIATSELRSGDSKSCGCLFLELKTKHGYCKGSTNSHPLYRVRLDMIDRCENPFNKSFQNYGERGIQVCDLWKNNPKAFIEWGIENGWEKGLQIDRKDNDRGYFPENCHFVTPMKNIHNQRLINSKNNSGFAGVSFIEKTGMFRARIGHNKKTYHIGHFPTAKEAALSRDAFIIKKGWNRNLNHQTEIVQAYIDSKKVV